MDASGKARRNNASVIAAPAAMTTTQTRMKRRSFRSNFSITSPGASAQRPSSSYEHAPPVDVQHLALNVAGEVGDQEQDRPGDVGGPRHPAKRDRGLDVTPAAGVREGLSRQVGLD